MYRIDVRCTCAQIKEVIRFELCSNTESCHMYRLGVKPVLSRILASRAARLGSQADVGVEVEKLNIG